MKRKILSVLLALAMASSAFLVSCGEDKSPVAETNGAQTDAVDVNPTETDPEEETPTDAPVVFTLSNTEGKPGDLIEVALSLSTTVNINSVALYELTYDKDVLTFKGFADYEAFEEERCVFPGGFDDSMEVIVLPMKDVADLNETVCTIRFEINEGAAAGTTAVEMTSLVKLYSAVIESAVTGAKITVAE